MILETFDIQDDNSVISKQVYSGTSFEILTELQNTIRRVIGEFICDNKDYFTSIEDIEDIYKTFEGDIFMQIIGEYYDNFVLKSESKINAIFLQNVDKYDYYKYTYSLPMVFKYFKEDFDKTVLNSVNKIIQIITNNRIILLKYIKVCQGTDTVMLNLDIIRKIIKYL